MSDTDPGAPLRGPDPAARLRRRALLPGLLGAGLALLAGAQTWWRATGDGVAVGFSGAESTAGLSQALGVVALAGWLLVLVLQARGRRVAGVLLALAGAGIAVLGALRQQPSAAAVRTRVREVSLADSFALGSSVWPYAYAAAGLLVVLCGVLTAATAARWPQRGDRFARDSAQVRLTSDEPADLWRAQDAGLDPTAEPDVRFGERPDTMGSTEERPIRPSAE